MTTANAPAPESTSSPVVPSPRVPLVLSPQHVIALPVVTPQVTLLPAIRIANVKLPVTAVGVERFSTVPSPMLPLSLYPQQYPAPAAVTAHIVS